MLGDCRGDTFGLTSLLLWVKQGLVPSSPAPEGKVGEVEPCHRLLMHSQVHFPIAGSVRNGSCELISECWVKRCDILLLADVVESRWFPNFYLGIAYMTGEMGNARIIPIRWCFYH
ncbi:hypothetical protein BHE74_00022412 [Ensete ventricosum]|nr:hypothetical protein BHE74_00022412 [Ensete ventricosum]